MGGLPKLGRSALAPFLNFPIPLFSISLRWAEMLSSSICGSPGRQGAAGRFQGRVLAEPVMVVGILVVQ